MVRCTITRNCVRNWTKFGPSTWRGRSDTEVLLNAIEQWGVRTSLDRINGMFAFAVWDRQERKLTLARDRMGEKPLYVGWVDANIVFASELKAFRRLPQWKHSVNRQALGLLLRFGYIPAPLSIHEGIFKLPAATFVEFGNRAVCRATEPPRVSSHGSILTGVSPGSPSKASHNRSPAMKWKL